MLCQYHSRGRHPTPFAAKAINSYRMATLAPGKQYPALPAVKIDSVMV
jgi:hypothetical protein